MVPSGFECLFDNFLNVYSHKTQNNCNIFEEFHREINYLQHINKSDASFLIQKEIDLHYKPFLDKVFENKLENLNLHIIDSFPKYDFFSDISKLYYEDKLLIKPYQECYTNVNKEFSNKKVICINGRNAIHKHSGRNNNMYNLIEKLINSGYFVINTTIVPPGFCFSKDCYMEIQENTPYNQVVSYFTNSDCVISIQNAAGISTHLLTESNFILLPSEETWVGNAKYGYNGKNLIELRNEKGYFTKILPEEQIITEVGSITKPQITKFSDSNKIKKI